MKNQPAVLSADVLTVFDDLEQDVKDLLVATQHLRMLVQHYEAQTDLDLFWWAINTVACNVEQFSGSVSFNRRQLADYFIEGVPVGPVEDDAMSMLQRSGHVPGGFQSSVLSKGRESA